MKNWNKTGKVKAIILGILFLPNIIYPIGAQPNFGIVMIFMPLFFGIIAIPIFTKLNASIFGQEIAKPTWNDNPLNFKKPLSFYHFGAIFLLVIGLSIIIGTAIKYQLFNLFGLSSIAFGIGILLGINLILKFTKKTQ